MNRPLYTPSTSDIQNSQMNQFRDYAEKHTNQAFPSYQALYHWSITDFPKFWELLATFTQVKWQTPPDCIYSNPTNQMPDAQWFTGAQLNYAENLLPPNTEEVFITGYQEGCPSPTIYRGSRIHHEVRAVANWLKTQGVCKGDRVAAVVSNTPETIIAMLAVTSLGAIWSSCSPDFGIGGILDRFGQIEPKVLICHSLYTYNGKTYPCGEVIANCQSQLPSLTAVLLLDQHSGLPTTAASSAVKWAILPTVIQEDDSQSPLSFTAMAFADPLFILFSSGTTGPPKCIVHSVGGTLLQHKKELQLHCNLNDNSRLFYYTTCGWMMWNWMVSALACGSKIVVYDGAVQRPDFLQLWRIVAQEQVTAFGTSPKFLSALMKQSPPVAPKELDLAPLKMILATGSPLLPEHCDWVYQNVKANVHLSSISGGTDIVSCFMLGNPMLPVFAGEIQAPGLGMAIAAWNEEGQPVTGTKGELVCTKPFVSMPVGFWGPNGRDKYLDAYFRYYKNLAEGPVWRHGDFIEVTPRGGIIVYGRSDATLNPGGIRIGTAEIYRQIESFTEFEDSLLASAPNKDDVDICLFVVMRNGFALDEELVLKLKNHIRSQLTPRHVPRRIHPVTSIPYTKSGKKVEIAVTEILAGKKITPSSALANPESLAQFYQFAPGNS